jgi:hypothetical protein
MPERISENLMTTQQVPTGTSMQQGTPPPGGPKNEPKAPTSADFAKQIAELKPQLTPDNPDFDKLVTDYTGLLTKHREAVRGENAGAVNKAKDALGEMIKAGVDSLGFAKLMGDEVITRVGYTFTPAKDKDGDTPAVAEKIVVTVNQAGRSPSVRRASTGGNGDRRNLIDDFEKYATDEQKAELAEIEAEGSTNKAGEVRTAKQRNSAAWALKDRVVGNATDPNRNNS